jgi:hypothetical protein
MLPLEGCHNLTAAGFDFATFCLLNKGLKFVPTPPPLAPGGLDPSMTRFARAVRLRCQFGGSSVAPKHRLPNRAYEPEHASPEIEQFLSALGPLVARRQQHVLSHCAARFKPNLTRAEQLALAALRRRGDIVIKPADKNLGLTIMRMEDYRAAVNSHVQDTRVYTPVEDVAAAIHTTCQQLAQLVACYQDHLGPKVCEYLLAGQRMTQVPHLYVLPKLHKMRPGVAVPTRPIAACHSWVTTHLSKYVADLLEGALSKYDTVLRDRTHLVAALEQCTVTADTYLLTFDVESLYPSIDQQQCAQACAEAIGGPGIQRMMVEEFLLFILRNNVVQAGGSHYRQVQGGAMGTNCLPQAAQLYLAVKWEAPLKRKLGAAFPAMYKRFIDDGFVIFRGTHAELLQFIACLDSELPNIRITHTHSQFQVEYMDLVVYKAGPPGAAVQQLRVRTHQKPLNRYLYIPWSSFHHPGMFNSFMHAELIRYVVTNSDPVWYHCMVRKFTHRLRERGYPQASIAAAVSRVSYGDRPRYLAAADQQQQHPQQPAGVLALVVPYSRDVAAMQLPRLLHDALHSHAEAAAALHGSGSRVLVCFTKNNNLGEWLVRASAF